MSDLRLTIRQRASWLAHLFKAMTQQHHGELRPLLKPYIADDAIVLDVGAHAGQFTKLFAGLAPRGRVYAFEPQAYARSILAPVARLHGHGRIAVEAVGLSDHAHETQLVTPLKTGGAIGFGLAHVRPQDGRAAVRPTRAETIGLTTLDAFAASAGLSRLDFIKADIEGYEGRMLAGGAATLARFKPALLLEVHPDHLARAGDTPDRLWALLTPLGYLARKVVDGRAAPPGGFDGSGDYLFAVSAAHPSRQA